MRLKRRKGRGQNLPPIIIRGRKSASSHLLVKRTGDEILSTSAKISMKYKLSKDLKVSED